MPRLSGFEGCFPYCSFGHDYSWESVAGVAAPTVMQTTVTGFTAADALVGAKGRASTCSTSIRFLAGGLAPLLTGARWSSSQAAEPTLTSALAKQSQRPCHVLGLRPRPWCRASPLGRVCRQVGRSGGRHREARSARCDSRAVVRHARIAGSRPCRCERRPTGRRLRKGAARRAGLVAPPGELLGGVRRHCHPGGGTMPLASRFGVARVARLERRQWGVRDGGCRCVSSAPAARSLAQRAHMRAGITWGAACSEWPPAWLPGSEPTPWTGLRSPMSMTRRIVCVLQFVLLVFWGCTARRRCLARPPTRRMRGERRAQRRVCSRRHKGFGASRRSASRAAGTCMPRSPTEGDGRAKARATPPSGHGLPPFALSPRPLAPLPIRPQRFSCGHDDQRQG